MRLDKTKPHAIPKDPEKAAAERRAKREAFGQAILLFACMGFVMWRLQSPSTFKHTFHFLQGLLS